jgi:hypothetical protein
VDFDARITHGADGDRQGDPLQQREVDMNVDNTTRSLLLNQ